MGVSPAHKECAVTMEHGRSLWGQQATWVNQLSLSNWVPAPFSASTPRAHAVLRAGQGAL